MNILLIAGHGAGDPGAIGNGLREADLVREIAPNIKKHIGSRANVTLYPTERNAYYDISNGYLVSYIKANAIDYVLEVHLNSGGYPYGTGTEIFITSLEDYATVEATVMNELGEIYPPKRGGSGVKVFDWGVIRTFKNYGISSALIECFFINNPDEVNRYLSDKNATAKAIADGIIKGFELGEVEETIKPAPTPEPVKPTKSNEEVAKEVIKGNYGNGADRRKNLKEAGYDYDVIQPIVDEMLGASTGNGYALASNGRLVFTYDECLIFLGKSGNAGQETGLQYNAGMELYYDGLFEQDGYLWAFYRALDGNVKCVPVRDRVENGGTYWATN